MAVWLALYAVTLTLYNYYHPLVAEFMVRRIQVEPSAWIIGCSLPREQISTGVDRIQYRGLELVIMRGCDGVEAWLLLITAMSVFRMPWRQRLLGIVLGSALVLALNITRIVTLFHIALRRPAWLDLAHGFIWQSIIVLSAAAFVLIWTAPKPTPVSAAAGKGTLA